MDRSVPARPVDHRVNLCHHHQGLKKVTSYCVVRSIYTIIAAIDCVWSCGVMVSTLDFESKDPSSSLGRT